MQVLGPRMRAGDVASSAASSAMAGGFILRDPGPSPDDMPVGPPRNLCTDCGLSRTDDHRACGKSCQFIQPDYPALERRVHGRSRDPDRLDETHFGPFLAMHQAALQPASPDAQWTGITTRIAERLLETGAVDAVIATAGDPADRWKPRPVIVTDPGDMAACRGMRMGYGPLLALIAPAVQRGLRRIAVIGIPCQIYALRAMEEKLGLEKLLVIGTPCSDNTTTANFWHFLSLLEEDPSTISYLEFRADFRVELRYVDGRTRTIPFLDLPISDLPADFFPLTCRTCVDYTNALADITVGYMGGRMEGRGAQWLIVRNANGQAMLNLLDGEVQLRSPGSRGRRHAAVAGFLKNVERAAGGLPLRRMPNWLRPIVSWVQPRFGPRGLEFARARVEMKAVETVLHLRRAAPRRMRHMVPAHVWALVAPYGLTPRDGGR